MSAASASPRPVDPRWVQIACLVVYSVVSHTIFHIERSNWLIAADVAWGVILDTAIGWLKYKTVRFPLTAIVIGLVSTVMIDSKFPLVYFLSTTVAILSKSLFTYRGKHFINPGNFGAVVIFQFAAGYAVGTQRIYAGYLWPTIVFFVMGMFTVIWARKLAVCASFLGGYVVFAFVRMAALGTPAVMALGPVLSPALLIYTFHMVSDPATTPRSPKGSLVFGFALALLDALLRMKNVPYGPFYALFLVSCSTPLYLAWSSREPLLGGEPAPAPRGAPLPACAADL